MSDDEPEPGEIDEHGFCKYCHHEAKECMCSVLDEWGKRE